MEHKARERSLLKWLGVCTIGVTVGLMASQVQGHSDGPKAKTVLEQAFEHPLKSKEAKVTLLDLTYEPGGSSEPHRHPGPVVVYVLEGVLEAQIGDGPIRSYRKGESFFEPANVRHGISRNGSKTEPARFLAYMLTSPEEKNLVLPTK